MRIVVIGTGRLASNLVPALQKVGHEVRVVNSRTLEGLPNEADAFVIAVKDDALESVARRVVRGREEQVFFHTAGSMPLSVFKGIVDIDISNTLGKQIPSNEHAKLFESVENLNLSARSFNCLDKAEIRFIGELAIMEENELKELKNLGKKSLEEIKAVMQEIGYPVGNPDLKDKKEQLRAKLEELKSQKSEG